METTEKTGKWFHTGHYMEDGKTPITVCAHNEAQGRRYVLQGFRPVEDIEGKGRRAVKRPVRRRAANERE